MFVKNKEPRSGSAWKLVGKADTHGNITPCQISESGMDMSSN